MINIFDKKTAVYQGVMSLLESGENPYIITVSQIALASRIGKGTVYEYFESKEEAIAGSLMYYMAEEIEVLKKELSEILTFKEMVMHIFDKTKDNMKKQYSCLSLLSALRNADDLYSFINISSTDFKCIRKSIEDTFNIIIEKGFKDGIINPKHSSYYVETALRSVLLGFQSFLKKREQFEKVDIEQAKEVGWMQLNLILGGEYEKFR